MQKLSKDGSIHVTDEVYNTLIASIGVLFATVGVVFLILKGLKEGQAGAVLSFSIYGFSMIVMFLSSALHHGVNGSARTNHLLLQVDYFAIFIMIAGTVTPFCLLHVKTTYGLVVLAVLWSLAVGGIILKAVWPKVPKWLMLSIFIGMGWMGLLIAQPVYQVIRADGLAMLMLGGGFYTVGAVIYGLEKPNPFPGRFGFHEIWHCFVLGGTASHFFLIYYWL
jgi:hemolysin III